MRFRRVPHVRIKRVDEQYVILDVKTEQLYGLDETGHRIWEYLKTPLTLDDLLDSLESTYDVDTEVLQDDIREFVDDLQRNGLITKTSL